MIATHLFVLYCGLEFPKHLDILPAASLPTPRAEHTAETAGLIMMQIQW